MIHNNEQEVFFKMTLNNVCSTASPSINLNPFSAAQYQYVLGTTALELTYDLEAIGNVSPSLICGYPVVEFVNGMGEPQLADGIVADYQNEKLIIGPSTDVAISGTKYMRFHYYNSMNSAVMDFSDVITIVIIDGCQPPANYSPQL